MVILVLLTRHSHGDKDENQFDAAKPTPNPNCNAMGSVIVAELNELLLSLKSCDTVSLNFFASINPHCRQWGFIVMHASSTYTPKLLFPISFSNKPIVMGTNTQNGNVNADGDLLISLVTPTSLEFELIHNRNNTAHDINYLAIGY